MTVPPDEPRWVEYHGLLALPGAWTIAAGPGAVVGHDREELMVATADVAVADVVALAADRPGWELLVAQERDDLCAALAAAGATVSLAVLHTLPDPSTVPDDDGDAVPLAATTTLDHVPADLRDELEAARARTTVWTIAVGDAAASFAYAASRSPRWFDVSIDTIPAFRGLGLATRAAAALIHAERAAGRAPVWGALDDNIASRRLAARLGFVAVDHLWVVSV